MGKMNGRLLTESDNEACEKLWDSSAHRYLVQHPEYARSSGSGKALRVGVFSQGQLRLVAFFDSIRRHGLETWRSPLFAPFCGALVSAEDSSRTGATAERFWRDALGALGEAIAPHADRAEIIFQPGVRDARELAWNGWELRPHYNYTTRWTKPGEWREQLEPATRRQERKALEQGLIFKVCEPSEIERSGMGALWKRNAVKQSLDASLDGNLGKLGKWLGSRGQGFCAFVANESGETHAAALIGYDDERVYYLAGASAPELLGSGGPTLLHTGILKEIDDRMLPRLYDWVGANTPNVVRFKRGFSPDLELLIAARFLSRKARLLEAARGVVKG